MVIVSAFIIFSEMEQMGNGAFLSRVVTAGLNRLEEVTNIPQMDTTSNKLVPKRFDIELRDVSFGYEKSRKLSTMFLCLSHREPPARLWGHRIR